MVVFVEVLRIGKFFKRFDLCDNMYGFEGGFVLVEILKLYFEFREVYLSDLGLEDEGVIVVFKVLMEVGLNVEVLEFGGNEIMEKVVFVLVFCIWVMKFLRRLVFIENELKDRGVVVVF